MQSFATTSITQIDVFQDTVAQQNVCKEARFTTADSPDQPDIDMQQPVIAAIDNSESRQLFTTAIQCSIIPNPFTQLSPFFITLLCIPPNPSLPSSPSPVPAPSAPSPPSASTAAPQASVPSPDTNTKNPNPIIQVLSSRNLRHLQSPYDHQRRKRPHRLCLLCRKHFTIGIDASELTGGDYKRDVAGICAFPVI